MLSRAVLAAALSAVSMFCADWNPRMAASYLDSRQKDWFSWPAANRTGVPCVSCHTGVPYLLARPALRQVLGESQPTEYETGLLEGIRAKVAVKDATDLSGGRKGPVADQFFGAQAVLAALLLATDDARRGRGLSSPAEQALARMWAAQIRSGPRAGAWLWTDANLDPWETSASTYYGAALAALAAGIAPGDYQSRPAIRESLAILRSYLATQREAQPLHNRMILLWAASKLGGILADAERSALIGEIRRAQEAGGAWTLAALGAWKERSGAPPARGGNSYATALAAYVLRQAGVARSDVALEKALDWLKAHQDPQGFWTADSMNKHYEPGSMPLLFMRDAATGYAAAALAE